MIVNKKARKAFNFTGVRVFKNPYIFIGSPIS